MITIVCLKCGTGIRTVGEEDELRSLFMGSDWYPENYPCANAECSAKAQYVETIESLSLPAMDIHDLEPMEAYAAIHGLGFPEERDCGKTAVELVFEQPVKEVKVRQIRGQNRSVIDYIIFEDGTRLYLASAVEGAVAYRIAKPHSYAEAADADRA
jgi:hypothetical protein